MGELVNCVNHIEDHVSRMQQEGVTVLRGFFTQKALDALEQASRALEVPPDEQRRKKFTRLAFGDGKPTPIVQELCNNDDFVSVIAQLLGPHQVITNLLLFELTPGQSGEKWHFGRRSFCFVGPDVPAYTIWIPLTPVKEKEQGGGVIWVPQDIFSAYSRIQQWTHVFRKVGEHDKSLSLARARQEQFGTSGDPWSGPFDAEVLEANKVESDFVPGDALLFSRNVWHRTSPLGSSNLPNRKAVVLRFADGRAHIDKKVVSGFASTLYPKSRDFLDIICECDDSVPIGKQSFATPLRVDRAVPDRASTSLVGSP